MAKHKEYKQNSMYVVELNEMDWYPNNVDKELVKEQFRQRAACADCELLVMFVIPDAVFSMCEIVGKHRVYEFRINAPAKNNFKVDVMFTSTVVASEYENLPAEGKLVFWLPPFH